MEKLQLLSFCSLPNCDLGITLDGLKNAHYALICAVLIGLMVLIYKSEKER